MKLLERLEGYARALDPRVAQVMAHIAGEYEVVLVAGSDGRLAADAAAGAVSITVFVDDKGAARAGLGGWRRSFRLRVFQRRGVAALCEGSRASGGDQPRRTAGTGRHHDGGARFRAGPASLLHEAVGHGLEGDFNRKGSSAFSGRIGSRVAAKGVTVVDDGTMPTGAARSTSMTKATRRSARC